MQAREPFNSTFYELALSVPGAITGTIDPDALNAAKLQAIQSVRCRVCCPMCELLFTLIKDIERDLKGKMFLAKSNRM